jgi:glycosyltransferase involved in cell wall biosynthesis
VLEKELILKTSLIKFVAMRRKLHLLFFVPNLEGGGSERVVSILLKYLDKSKFDLTLALVKKKGVFLEDIPMEVKVIDLDSSRTRNAIIKIVKTIRAEKPDIVFSTLGHLNLILASIRVFFSRTIVFIARESSMVSLHNKNEVYPFLFDILFRTVYHNFDKIICQSMYMRDDLLKNYRIPKKKISVINNPVDSRRINESILDDYNLFNDSKINFITVGRMSLEKGFEDVIKAFSYVKSPNIHLTMIGEGILRPSLERLSLDLDLSNKITFLGFQKNPYKYMSKAKCLVLTSHYEGFPNVVLEANACGIPVIAFNSPGGVSEIIDNGKNGWLIENRSLTDLAKKIEETASQNFEKDQIKNYIEQRFGVTKILRQYQELFDNFDATQ